MMNMTPAVRLILALEESAMLFMVRHFREKTEISAPSTLRTTPTIMSARTAWNMPAGRPRDTEAYNQ